MAAKYFRIHAIGGDFKNLKYLEAWMKVAEELKHVTFYTYTHVPTLFIRKRGDEWEERKLPDNMRIVLSANTPLPQWKNLLSEYASIPQAQRKYKIAHVVRSKKQAEEMGLPVDHDDVMAASAIHDFAIIIHGEQKKGSKAGKDVYKAKREA